MAPHFQGSSTRSEDEELACRYEEQVMLSAKKKQVTSTLCTGLNSFVGRKIDERLRLEIVAETERLLGATLRDGFDIVVEDVGIGFGMTVVVK